MPILHCWSLLIFQFQAILKNQHMFFINNLNTWSFYVLWNETNHDLKQLALLGENLTNVKWIKKLFKCICSLCWRESDYLATRFISCNSFSIFPVTLISFRLLLNYIKECKWVPSEGNSSPKVWPTSNCPFNTLRPGKIEFCYRPARVSAENHSRDGVLDALLKKVPRHIVRQLPGHAPLPTQRFWRRRISLFGCARSCAWENSLRQHFSCCWFPDQQSSSGP